MTVAIYKLSIDQYDRMIEAGVFDEDVHIELIQGELHEMPPIGPLHENAVDLLAKWSFRSIGDRPIRVRTQNSIGLAGFESVPEPDIVWVGEKSYRQRRPQIPDVKLVIEVSDSSLDFDRFTKSELYAAAKVPEYWIVNVQDFCVEVYRSPAGRRYRKSKSIGTDKSISPLCLPEASLDVGWLFGVRD